MTDELRKKIEDYVDDWHFDEASKIFAFNMGTFLFGFMKYLETLDLAERNLRHQKENVWLIGSFECGYGYRTDETFDPEMLEDGPMYEYEFERKVSDSPTAISSYKATWKRLDKYIKNRAYRDFLLD